MEKVRILHTNDLHSHFENWPKLRRFMKERQRTAENESVITVDLGDFADRWHPLTEVSEGQENVALMNQANYDLATIGNNEGIGNAKEVLNHLYDFANFEVIVANLFDKHTLKLPKWAQQSKILTTENGTKVGFIAMTAPFPLTYAPNGWDIRQWTELLPTLVHQMRPKVDVLVLMSHLGIADDQLIAQELPEIDVILGSHTHHHFPNGQKVNGVQLAAAGKFGQFIGEVTLFLDKQHHLLKTTAQTFATEEMLAYPEDTQEEFQYMENGHRRLQEKKVAWLPQDLNLSSFDQYSLILETLEALRSRGETQVALLNSGLFLGELSAGLVNQDQLHTLLPHPMRLIRVKMLGRDVIRMVLEIEKNRAFLKHYPMRGMGFRGKVFGEIVYDGLSYDATNQQIYWQGQSIEEERTYAFTTVDHLMFIPFIPSIEIAGSYEFLFPEFIRTVLANHLARKYPLTALE